MNLILLSHFPSHSTTNEVLFVAKKNALGIVGQLRKLMNRELTNNSWANSLTNTVELWPET